jgi:hypothetical protein
MTHSSEAPRMGVHFPLADFEQRIMADPDVLGMMYNGSLGRGETDLYSDLDISLWLRDEALAKDGRVEHYVSWLGAIRFVSYSQHEGGVSSIATSALIGSQSNWISRARTIPRPTRTSTVLPLSRIQMVSWRRLSQRRGHQQPSYVVTLHAK